MVWTLELRTPGHLDSRHLDSGLLDAWTLDNWSNGLWSRGLWALGLWIIRTKKLFQFFVIFLFFLNISNTLRLVLLKVLRVIVIILTCYNWYYISNSLARQQLDLKGNFLRRGQIINSKIIQTDDQSFPTYQRAHFLSYISDILQKIYQIYS